MLNPYKTVAWIFLVMMSLSVQAEVYKWVDEQGRVHYGDKPTSENANEVKIKSAPTSGQAGQSGKRKALQERFLRAREDERKEKQKARAEQKQKRAEAKRNCEQAKKDYDKYRYASGLYHKGEDGEREYLSFKQRAEYEKSLLAKIKKWCG